MNWLQKLISQLKDETDKPMTPYKFSMITEIPRSTITRITNGKINSDNLTLTTLEKIAKGANMGVGELVDFIRKNQ